MPNDNPDAKRSTGRKVDVTDRSQKQDGGDGTNVQVGSGNVTMQYGTLTDSNKTLLALFSVLVAIVAIVAVVIVALSNRNPSADVIPETVTSVDETSNPDNGNNSAGITSTPDHDEEEGDVPAEKAEVDPGSSETATQTRTPSVTPTSSATPTQTPSPSNTPTLSPTTTSTTTPLPTTTPR